MKLNPFHLSGKIKNKIVYHFLTRPVGQCGTQNHATREAWLEQTLANLPIGQRILDAGAGELQYKRFCAHLDYVSQDFAEYDGQGDEVGLQTGSWDNSKLDIICDITEIPEPDTSFDAIMCIEVFEHISNPILALQEFTRLLKTGGVLIITAPFCSLTHFAPYFFYSGYSRYFYEHWLAEFGYEIEVMEWNGNYFEYLAQELIRLPSIGMEYVGIKPSLFEKIAIALLLRFLNKLSQRDEKSKQLLAYGLHVQARKTK